MNRIAFLVMLLACIAAPARSPAADKLAAVSRAKAARKLSEKIDQHLQARFSAEQIEPAPQADDAEFCRRVWLHLSGAIPPVSEVRRFLADSSPDKRSQLIDDLLERPSYIREFTTFWRRAWLPEAETDPLVQARVPALESWLQQELMDEKAYHQMVRELLTVSLPTSAAASPASMNENANGPLAYYLAKDAKPENLAAGASRAFLGVRLDCAQCHDHPFDKWKQDQFWSFAAFFAGLERETDQPNPMTGRLREEPGRQVLRVADTERLVSAVFLDNTETNWRSRNGREVLAEWITAPKNSFFAQAAVNRLWGHLFGVGIVDPVDDFSPANPPSHPELLEELAAAFVARNYDVKFLLQSIMGSQAYQRTSRQVRGDLPLQLFVQMPVQGLSSEQLLRSLSMIVGANSQAMTPPQPGLPMPDNFATLFTRPGESATQRQTTILQALALMNGRMTATAVNVEDGPLLSAVIDFPATTEDRIETLFLATLSRRPKAEESARFVKYVDSAADARTAFTDVLWALLNSAEFACNH